MGNELSRDPATLYGTHRCDNGDCKNLGRDEVSLEAVLAFVEGFNSFVENSQGEAVAHKATKKKKKKKPQRSKAAQAARNAQAAAQTHTQTQNVEELGGDLGQFADDISAHTPDLNGNATLDPRETTHGSSLNVPTVMQVRVLSVRVHRACVRQQLAGADEPPSPPLPV